MGSSSNLRSKLGSVHPAFGVLQSSAQPIFTEIAADVGLDFLVLDGEHGQFSDGDCLVALLALKGSATAALIRTSGIDPPLMARMLDLGVDGVIVPDIRTTEQAQVIARAMRHAPEGSRGNAGPLARRARYRFEDSAVSDAADERPLLVAMIESAQGAANAPAIAAVPGIDALVIGPFDLSADLGRGGDFATHDYRDAVESIERATRQYGKAVGTAPHPGFGVEQLVARGHRLILLSADVVLMRESLVSLVKNARGVESRSTRETGTP